MKTGYFDTNTDYDFTLRTFWEEKNGTVTPTKIQAQSKTYGDTWFLGGTIKVNGVTALTMSYQYPATHYFEVYGVGDSWLDITGDKPVSVGPITDKAKATIEIDVVLYRNVSSPKPELTASVEIPLTTGLVQIQTVGGVKRHRAYIKQDGQAVPLATVTKKDGTIKYCT